MCVITEIDALALQELGDEMALVFGAYPQVPRRQSYFGGSRSGESNKIAKVVELKLPRCECEKEIKFLQGMLSVQDGEISIGTIA